MPARPSVYERLGTVSIHIVLHTRGPLVAHGVRVSTGGLRMRTFRASGPNPKCSCCGLRATHFAVERHKGTTGGYHLNLWGIGPTGNEVLFTHDHTVARALGGADKDTNTTTMCDRCNFNKSKVETVEIRRRRGELDPENSKSRVQQRSAAPAA